MSGIFPDFSGLARASQKFVVRKHIGGLWQSATWWLYTPDGERFDVVTFKNAVKIAQNTALKYEADEQQQRMAAIQSKLRAGHA
jgi:hypothetical protein